MDYKRNIEQVNNQQDSKEENIITTSSDIDTNGFKEEFYVLENDKIKLEFTKQGSEISSVVIKGTIVIRNIKI